ncbi:hypothetical protein RY27_00615 [Litorilinea aerophila]|nr:hypothetical protein RY27_00615 [Litorilinea aerophila]
MLYCLQRETIHPDAHPLSSFGGPWDRHDERKQMFEADSMRQQVQNSKVSGRLSWKLRGLAPLGVAIMVYSVLSVVSILMILPMG